MIGAGRSKRSQVFPPVSLNHFPPSVSVPFPSDEFDAYIIVSFVNATLVLSIGETVEEVTDSGFLGTTPTLSCSLLGEDALVQVRGFQEFCCRWHRIRWILTIAWVISSVAHLLCPCCFVRYTQMGSATSEQTSVWTSGRLPGRKQLSAVLLISVKLSLRWLEGNLSTLRWIR